MSPRAAITTGLLLMGGSFPTAKVLLHDPLGPCGGFSVLLSAPLVLIGIGLLSWGLARLGSRG